MNFLGLQQYNVKKRWNISKLVLVKFSTKVHPANKSKSRFDSGPLASVGIVWEGETGQPVESLELSRSHGFS